MREELKYVPVNEEQIEKINEVKNSISFAMTDVDINCPPSREKSLALTKLEEAAMWASKAISHNKELNIKVDLSKPLSPGQVIPVEVK